MLGRFLRHSTPIVAMLGVLLVSQSGFAQGNPPNTPGFGGVEIDANGVLTKRALTDNSGVLNQQRAMAAKSSLNRELQTPSELRKVSLTRLEREVKKLIDAGKPIPEDMKYLAGLTGVTHVFYYPETKDIVIAGPAEGHFITVDNHVCGTQSGHATLQLQDLVVALRTFSPTAEKTNVISCSIDPTREGLLKMRDAYASVAGQFRPGQEQAVVQLFQEALGYQEITIQGVPTKSHFARVLVEADYHMKLIGIGLEQPPVRIVSFIEKAQPNSVAQNSLQRWYFQPDYDCVTISDDQQAMQLSGNGVKLVGEDESVARDGERKTVRRVNGASQAYCASFTKMYSQLADKSPLWGELRNLIDISIAAAFIQKADLFAAASWDMEVFGDEAQYPVEILNTPSHVAPVANAVWKGNFFMTPIAGGVNIQPRIALNSDRVKQDTEGRVSSTKAANESKLNDLADGQWWWD